MIKDYLENASTYFNISESLKKGFEWLKTTDLKNIDCGQYEIDGKNIYANVQEYETKTEAKYEAHKKYIDIQYMIQGKELIGVTNISNCSSCIKYDSEKDIEFFELNSQDEYLELSEGNFLVLFPHDAHKPSISYKDKATVKKVVVKVLIN